MQRNIIKLDRYIDRIAREEWREICVYVLCMSVCACMCVESMYSTSHSKLSWTYACVYIDACIHTSVLIPSCMHICRFASIQKNLLNSIA